MTTPDTLFAAPDLGTVLLTGLGDEVLRYAYALGARAALAVIIGVSAAIVVAVLSRRPVRRRTPVRPRTSYATPPGF